MARISSPTSPLNKTFRGHEPKIHDPSNTAQPKIRSTRFTLKWNIDVLAAGAKVASDRINGWVKESTTIDWGNTNFTVLIQHKNKQGY